MTTFAPELNYILRNRTIAEIGILDSGVGAGKALLR